MTNCGYTDLFPIDPLETVNQQVMWICGTGSDTKLYATWTIHKDYEDCKHRWILYVNGIIINENSPNLISIDISSGIIPKIAAVAVPELAPLGTDPLAGSTNYNIRSMNYELAQPIRADMKILENKVTIYYKATKDYYNHIIINGELIDSSGTNGEEYSVTIDPTNIQIEIAIVPLPFITGTDLFDCALVDMFSDKLCPDIILPEYKYVPYMQPTQEIVLGKTKNNYVDYTLKQKGLTIKTRMTLGSRKVVRGNSIITKPAKKNQLVVGPQDYRFYPQFDKTRFFTIYNRDVPNGTIPCFVYRLLSYSTTTQVKLAAGTYPTSLMSL